MNVSLGYLRDILTPLVVVSLSGLPVLIIFVL